MNDNKLLSVSFKRNLHLSEMESQMRFVESSKSSSLPSKVIENDTQILSKSNKNSIRIRTQDLTKKYCCSFPKCQKEFGKKSRLVLHERTHTGERPFKCEYEGCQRSYTRQFHLTRHIAVFHSSSVSVKDSDKFRCDICDRAYSNEYSLKKHSRTHQEQRFSCPHCSQTFVKQQHLKTHSSQHTGIFPYRCSHPGCDKGFPLPSKLARHSKIHVPDRYNCEYQNCNKKFNLYSQLVQHLAKSHPKICDVCGKSFLRLNKLRSHLLTHQESREAFFCPFSPCERYYLDPRNLQNHINAKHEENFKGFLCHICEKWLVTKQKLKEHIITHDPNRSGRKQNETKRKRKPRKDKGTIKRNLPQYLSGYDPKKSSQEPIATMQDVSEVLPTEGGEPMRGIGGEQTPTRADVPNPRESDFVANQNEEAFDSSLVEMSDSLTVEAASQEMTVEERESSLNILGAIASNKLKLLLKKGSSTIFCKLPSKAKA